MEVAEHLPPVVIPGQLLHDSVWELLLGLGIYERAVWVFPTGGALQVAGDDDMGLRHGGKPFDGLVGWVDGGDDDVSH